MKNLDDFSIETPYNIMGSQSTGNLDFDLENQGKNENVKITF